MYLSRVELDPLRRPTIMALGLPRKLHGAVEDSFKEFGKRHLWRVDKVYGRTFLMIVSEEKPELSGIEDQFGIGSAPQITDYDKLLDSIKTGDRYTFRITAAPTYSVLKKDGEKKRGTVKAHSTPAHQMQWLKAKAEKNGFLIKDGEFTVVSAKWLHFMKKQTFPVSFMSVTFEGTLTVTDAEKFVEALKSGIGREKAYGHGMMTIMP